MSKYLNRDEILKNFEDYDNDDAGKISEDEEDDYLEINKESDDDDDCQIVESTSSSDTDCDSPYDCTIINIPFIF